MEEIFNVQAPQGCQTLPAVSRNNPTGWRQLLRKILHHHRPLMMVCMLALSLFISPGIRMSLLWYSLFNTIICMVSDICDTRTAQGAKILCPVNGYGDGVLARSSWVWFHWNQGFRVGGLHFTDTHQINIVYSITQILGVRGSIDLLGSSVWYAFHGAIHPQRNGYPR